MHIQVPQQLRMMAADAAGGARSTVKKRKLPDETEDQREPKFTKCEPSTTAAPPSSDLMMAATANPPFTIVSERSEHAKPRYALPNPNCASSVLAVQTLERPASNETTCKKNTKKQRSLDDPNRRKIRLEQNRKAARESRRRKKLMIEELQRSATFFSQANGTLRQQNEDLTRRLEQAQATVRMIESGYHAASSMAVQNPLSQTLEEAKKPAGQAEATPVVTEETTPTPSASSAPASHSSTTTTASPSMQPGVTMQAMENFQRAASAAMQNALQGIQSTNPSLLAQLASPPSATNMQQAFVEIMTALAMQHQMASNPGMAFLAAQAFQRSMEEQQQSGTNTAD